MFSVSAIEKVFPKDFNCYLCTIADLNFQPSSKNKRRKFVIGETMSWRAQVFWFETKSDKAIAKLSWSLKLVWLKDGTVW